MPPRVDSRSRRSPDAPDGGAACDALAPAATRREPRETSGMTSRLMLLYAEREGGPGAVSELLARAGMSDRREEFLDENAWFSFETKVELFQALTEVLGDPKATRRAGAAALELTVA